jgi:hypothetical protein
MHYPSYKSGTSVAAQGKIDFLLPVDLQCCGSPSGGPDIKVLTVEGQKPGDYLLASAS